jgi:hypothetical protein
MKAEPMTPLQQSLLAILFDYKTNAIKTDQALKEIEQAIEYHSKPQPDDHE